MATAPEHILQRIYDTFRDAGQWPSVRSLLHEYRHEGSFRTIAARIGRDRIICQEGSHGVCYLPLAEVARRDHATADLQLVCGAVRLAAKRYLLHGAQPIDQRDFASALNVHGAALTRLGRLLALEQHVFTEAASSNAEMSGFSYTPGERALHFEDVHTFGDYEAVVARVIDAERERGQLTAREVAEGEADEANDLFFPANALFRPRQAVYRILRLAASDVLVVDPYLDPLVLDFVDALEGPVTVRLLAGKPSKLFIQQVGVLQGLRPGLEARRTRASHDRWIVVDRRHVWHLGASLNGLGKAASRISRPDPTTAAAVLVEAEEWWRSGTAL